MSALSLGGSQHGHRHVEGQLPLCNLEERSAFYDIIRYCKRMPVQPC